VTEGRATTEQNNDNINKSYCELRPNSHLNIFTPDIFKLPSSPVVFVLLLLKIKENT
jgi:hypothetical protein